MEEKIKKQLEKIEKNKHYINYYDLNSIRECYMTLKECLARLEYDYNNYNLIEKIKFNIKVSNNIIKNNKELLH